MSDKLNTIVGKQNDFATRFMGGGTIAIGDVGVTLTPPAGQRVRLTHLSTAAGTSESNMNVTFGSTVVLSAHEIDGENPSGSGSSVGSYQDYAAGNPPNRNYSFWTGGVDEPLGINKNTGNTTAIIYYGYEFGE